MGKLLGVANDFDKDKAKASINKFICASFNSFVS